MAEVRDSQDIDGKTNFDVGGKPLLTATSHLIYPCGADLPNNCYPWMIGKNQLGIATYRGMILVFLSQWMRDKPSNKASTMPHGVLVS